MQVVLDLAEQSSDLNLVAEIAAQLYWSGGDELELSVQPFIKRVQQALDADELPLATLLPLYAAFHTEDVFDVVALRGVIARACVRELRLADAQHIADAGDWSALGPDEATVLLDLALNHLPLAGRYEGSGVEPMLFDSPGVVASVVLGVLAPIAIPDPLARLERLCSAFEDDEDVRAVHARRHAAVRGGSRRRAGAGPEQPLHRDAWATSVAGLG